MAQRAKTAPRSTAAKTRKAPAKTSPATDIPALEWISAGVGLLLALTAIGFTAWDAAFGAEGPPVIEVRLKHVTATPHGYVAEVEAYNHGGAPAAQVQVEGVVTGRDGPETSGLTLDYIPEQSRATGGLMFNSDPRSGGLKLRAAGFADPS